MPRTQLRTLLQQQLPETFYLQNNVVALAKNLVGKILVTNFAAGITAGRIV
jgi:3-methyladenine DNA glycosylase Mpg